MKKQLQYLENGKALSGFDPISTYLGQAELGDESIHSTYEDARYLFISLENKKEFDQNPKKYAPKYGGYCSIAISEGALVEANPKSALIQDNELHVFYKDEDEDTQDEWKENPIENKIRAEEAWKKLND